MKNLEKMINEIDIDSLEKTINILTGLKVFMKIEKKEIEKSIEKQIFELIGYDLDKLNFPANDFDFFKKAITECQNSFYQQCLFLAIMKGVHQLIEGDNNKFKDWYIYSCYNEYYFMRYKNMIHYPEYFYFSSKENTEKAFDILSNFFGINILNWWYK